MRENKRWDPLKYLESPAVYINQARKKDAYMALQKTVN